MTGGANESSRLRALFDDALAQPLHLRDAWLAQHAPGADERAAVARLLAAHARTSLVDTPAHERAARIGLAETPPIGPPAIPGFRLLGRLGQGGMATVYLAERDEAGAGQRVAIKVLNRAIFDEADARAFARERRALAALSHPHIAHLIDGGVTATGFPYLVIEHVDGVPLTEFAKGAQLDLHARLQLAATVCDAVAAAHTALVVHRDLKPSNIFVRRDGHVKLLDFGIAKLLAEPDEATRTGLAALTPGYAAPEQFAGGPVTTATDVYALGVVVHELVTGVRPRLVGDQFERPSRLPGARALRGDLDQVLLKALAPTPATRYASAADLARDLRRWIAGLPVSAHAPSTGYRLKKFVTRHRIPVAIASAAAVAVVVALALALQQARLATAEAARAAEVQAFVEDVFAPVAEGVASSDSPTLAELVERARERLRDEPLANPATRAELLALFARIANGAGEVESNAALAAEAYAAVQAAFGERDMRTLDAGLVHARVLRLTGKLDEADGVYGALLASADAAPGSARGRWLEARAALLEARGAPADESLALKREAVAARESDAASDPADLATSYNNLGAGYDYARRYDDALEWYGRAEALRRSMGRDSVGLATVLANIATVLSWQGRWDEAQARLDEAESIYAGIGAPRHPNLVSLKTRECDLAAQRGETGRARGFCDEAVAMAIEVQGADAVATAIARVRRAGASFAAGDAAAAQADLARARPVFEAAGGRAPALLTHLALTEIPYRRAARDYAAVQALVLPIASADGARDAPHGLLAEAWAHEACTARPAPGCAAVPFGASAEARLAEPRWAAHPHALVARVSLAKAALDSGDAARAAALLELGPGMQAARALLAPSHPILIEHEVLAATARRRGGSANAELDARAAAAVNRLPASHPLRESLLEESR